MVLRRPNFMEQKETPRWFSANESKAWGEKFFLIYSPVWMLIIGVVTGLGIHKNLGDVGYMVLASVIALPLVIIPAIFRNESHLNHRWYQTYWFKANLYIFIYSFPASYFGTEYFFDILGMIYKYPTIQLNFDAELVGSGQQKVPVIMYLLAQAYLITYHSHANIPFHRKHHPDS